MANGVPLSSCSGKKLLYIINLGTKVNSVYYCNGILSQTISEMIALSGGDLLFQQDWASSTHLITYCVILMRTPPLLLTKKWPPTSPDLNPMDYGQCWKRKCAKWRSATLITLRTTWERHWQLFHRSTSPALSFILQLFTGLYCCWRRAFQM